jgi:hypothetical protein
MLDLNSINPKKIFMKKLLTILLLISVFSFDYSNLNAQTFDMDSNALNLGIGVGGRFGLGFGVHASYEQAFKKTGDFGIIGVGAMTGLRFSDAGLFGDFANYRELAIAPRATYHFSVIDVEKLDVYAAVQIGISLVHTSSDNTNISENDVDIVAGPVAGVRYQLSNGFNIFGEVGYNLFFATGGLAFSF